MSPRSYAQPTWSKGRLALDMINPRRQRFILYAEPLTSLLRNAGEYVLVKRRDRHPEKTSSHHGGDVWAKLEDAETNWRLALYFGALEQRLCQDKEGNLLYWIGIQVHLFPKAELENLNACFVATLEQMRIFDRLKREADTSTTNMEYRE